MGESVICIIEMTVKYGEVMIVFYYWLVLILGLIGLILNIWLIIYLDKQEECSF